MEMNNSKRILNKSDLRMGCFEQAHGSRKKSIACNKRLIIFIYYEVEYSGSCCATWFLITSTCSSSHKIYAQVVTFITFSFLFPSHTRFLCTLKMVNCYSLKGDWQCKLVGKLCGGPSMIHLYIYIYILSPPPSSSSSSQNHPIPPSLCCASWVNRPLCPFTL